MSQFSYSFCLSLFHSLWQCALLLVFYSAIQPFIKRQLPSFKRNVLYGLLLAQFIISGITFFIYYNGSVSFYRDIIESGFSGLMVKQPLIEKLSPWIISVYSSIIFFKSLSLIYNWYRFKKLCSTAMIKPSVDLKLFTLKKAQEFGIHRKVTLWFSNNISTPLTYGFFKPVILMPVALLNHVSIKDAESLIIHELTHIKNNDYLLNWLLVVAETLFFYNPFVRIIAGKIKLEREKNCDVQVLQFQYPVINYAETLLKAAKLKTNISFFPLAAVFKNKQLLQRISFFTTGHNLVFSRRKYNAISLSVILSALLVNLLIIIKVKNYKETRDMNVAAFAIPATVVPAEFPAETTNEIGEPESADTELAPPSPETGRSLDIAVDEVNEELKKVNLASKLANAKVAELCKKQLDLNYTIHPVVNINVRPVVNVQTDEQDIIVQEEKSGTALAVTKAYKLKWKDGKWKKDLVYIVKENRPSKDSICVVKDSVVSYIPPMQ